MQRDATVFIRFSGYERAGAPWEAQMRAMRIEWTGQAKHFLDRRIGLERCPAGLASFGLAHWQSGPAKGIHFAGRQQEEAMIRHHVNLAHTGFVQAVNGASDIVRKLERETWELVSSCVSLLIDIVVEDNQKRRFRNCYAFEQLVQVGETYG